MRGELYFHIGSPKTGTTAIQHLLTDNREKLASQGVLYPVAATLKAAHHMLGAAVFPGRGARLAGVPRDVAFQDAVSGLLAEMEAAQPKRVIISTEYFWGDLSPNKIRRLLEPFKDWNIHILAYLRRQDLFAQSLYLQAVKSGYAGQFDYWLATALEGDKGGFYLDRVLDAWRNCGIPLSVEPRVYEKGQVGSDVRRDFMNAVAPGVEVDYPEETHRLNTTPDMATIGIVRMINSSLENNEDTNKIRRRIIAQSPPRNTSAPLSYFREGEAEVFMKRFEACNANVARTYLKRPDGVLFKDAVGTGGESITNEAILDRLVVMLPKLVVFPVRKPKPVGANKIPRKKRLRQA
jgi:hypothetical protein